MKPADDIKKFFKNAAIDTNPKMDEAVLNKVLKSHEKTTNTKSAATTPNIRRTIMKSRITKLAAAATIIAVVSIGILYIAKDHGGSVALGDVVKIMQQTKTVTWTLVSEINVPKEMEKHLHSFGFVSQCMYKAPGHQRMEMTQKLRDPKTKLLFEDKQISILNHNVGMVLLLNPKDKTARIGSIEPAKDNDPLLDAFLNPTRSLPSDAESLGSKRIGGQEAVGFRFYKKGDGTDFWTGAMTDIWVDANTKRVVLVETSDGDDTWRHVYRLKDFVYDQELNDSLFSLKMPEGYEDIGPPKFMSFEPSSEE
jgi:outer membrane lipoprotein-sorting protein